MTGTAHGLMIYHIQDCLKKEGHDIGYAELSKALCGALMEMTTQIPTGASFEMPNGDTFCKTFTIGDSQNQRRK